MTTPSTNKKLKCVFLVLLLLCLLPVHLVWAVQLVTDYRLGKQVDGWGRKAQGDALPGMTLEDARDWLQKNGFQVEVWDRNSGNWVGAALKDVTRSNPHGVLSHYIVRGARQLREGGLITEPAWVNVTFRFNLDETFSGVEARIRRYPLPTAGNRAPFFPRHPLLRGADSRTVI